MNSWDDAEKLFIARARQLSCRVLIWGKGKPGRKTPKPQRLHYEKRLKIKSTLRKNYPQAAVYFSEDPERAGNLPTVRQTLVKEAAQAHEADLILALATPGARGVDAELDTMSAKYGWFPPKAHILVPEEYLDTKGLVSEIYGRFPKNNVVGFTPEQFSTCKVSSELAVGIVDTWAIDRLLSGFSE